MLARNDSNARPEPPVGVVQRYVARIDDGASCL